MLVLHLYQIDSVTRMTLIQGLLQPFFFWDLDLSFASAKVNKVFIALQKTRIDIKKALKLCLKAQWKAKVQASWSLLRWNAKVHSVTNLKLNSYCEHSRYQKTSVFLEEPDDSPEILFFVAYPNPYQNTGSQWYWYTSLDHHVAF